MNFRINKLLYSLLMSVLGTCSSALSQTEFVNSRGPGDSRKFEATHFLQTKTGRDVGEKIYLNSGSVIGAREFSDPSTLIFELATGSRLGHVGIVISFADIYEIIARFEDRCSQIREEIGREHDLNDINRSKKKRPPDLGYKEWGNKYGWCRELKPGKGETDFFKNSSATGISKIYGRLNFECKNSVEKKIITDLREQIRLGSGTAYDTEYLEPDANSKVAWLDNAMIFEMSPGDMMFATTLEPICLSPTFFRAIKAGDTSIIEPKNELSIEQLEKMIFYAAYLKDSKASYNYTQTDAGIYKQNCSEFVHNSFLECGLSVGHKQAMDSLNINAMGGGLRAAMRITGLYGADNIVVTPKSVMQTAVENSARQEVDSNTAKFPMRLVNELDNLDVKETISDADIWKEWNQKKKIDTCLKLAVGVLGGLGAKPSSRPFEVHSEDGQHRRVTPAWSNAQLAGIGALTMGVVLGVYYPFKYFFNKFLPFRWKGPKKLINARANEVTACKHKGQL